MILQDNISHLLQQKGTSNRAAAKKLGVSSNLMWKLEHTESYDPKVSTLMKVAEYFGVTLDDLIYKDLSKDNK